MRFRIFLTFRFLSFSGWQKITATFFLQETLNRLLTPAVSGGRRLKTGFMRGAFRFPGYLIST